ncbi:hypothetical protein BDBG_16490 [Blastomyces gilchristii SLH14081]|uniref:Integrase zinc-binding domain-containing protein n=1 Tax=Blastomyces gilchristii (strain SLH14081) TaxID=559298 RepID=A0A179UEQ1_BLAGS|nr:uncharacterized protein BDBG_16490 [Blastomyces gilchristii SLH14081]OAT05768.1 hypothetical protein BDBG_16490 [Blastomyces gilchristii SLH14081]
MISYLKNDKMSDDKYLMKVIEEMLSNFKLRKLKNNIVLYCDLEYAEAPYLEPSFRHNLIAHIHKEFSHLESSELISILKSRAYWSSMAENIQMYTHECLNYQVVKESKKGLECEKVQYQMKFSEVIEKMIVKFLYNEIYVNYRMLHEILTDNSANLVEEVMNRKMKCLNEILSNILMKYLVSKPMRL